MKVLVTGGTGKTGTEVVNALLGRGASVRVPHSFMNNGHRGYLEDRRPNSLGDPYCIAGRILETITEADMRDAVDEAVAA